MRKNKRGRLFGSIVTQKKALGKLGNMFISEELQLLNQAPTLQL